VQKVRHTCAFRTDFDPVTLEPRGPQCGKPATQELYWADGRVSPSCQKHGLRALDKDARSASPSQRRTPSGARAA